MEDDTQSPHSRQERRCAFCDRLASITSNLMKCSGCLITYYCDRDHQVQDWKRHKQLCKQLQTKRTNENDSVINEHTNISDVKSTSIDNIRDHRSNSDRSIDSVIESARANGSNYGMKRSSSTIDPSKELLNYRSTVSDNGDQSVHTSRHASGIHLAELSRNGHHLETINPLSKRSSSELFRTEILSSTDITHNLDTHSLDTESVRKIRRGRRRRSTDLINVPNVVPRLPIESQKRPRDISSSQCNRQAAPKRARRSDALISDDKKSNSLSAIAISSEDGLGLKKDHSLNYPLDLDNDGRLHSKDSMSMRLAKMAQFVAAGLREYGWAIVDKFLGERHCRCVLQEMQKLQEQGQFMDARLLKSKIGTQMHGIRSDMILFLTNGSDDGINIGLFVSLIDSLIFHLTGSVPPYNISGRTKPMLTCYPGQRSRYLTHVDNPDKDGRCITVTYYLNEDWRPAHGGLLRVYPTSALKPVDIEPIFDRLVFYWSDRRNPHEVLPSYRKRFSINLWYFDSEEKMAAENNHFQNEDLLAVKESCGK